MDSADIHRAKRLLLAAYNNLQNQPRSLHTVRTVIVVRWGTCKILLRETPTTMPLWLEVIDVASDMVTDRVGFLTIDEGIPHLSTFFRDDRTRTRNAVHAGNQELRLACAA